MRIKRDREPTELRDISVHQHLPTGWATVALQTSHTLRQLRNLALDLAEPDGERMELMICEQRRLPVLALHDMAARAVRLQVEDDPALASSRRHRVPLPLQE